MRRCALRWLAALALAAACGAGTAHELPANRLTLVQREPGHVSLTFYVDYARVLHRTLAPRQDFREFALLHAAMEPGAWAQTLRRAQARLESGTRLATADGRQVPVGTWRWPAADRVQALMQQHAMRAVVGPGEHEHDAPTEIQSQAVGAASSGPLIVKLPDEFQAVLVVWYRPAQAWSRPGAAPLAVRF